MMNAMSQAQLLSLMEQLLITLMAFSGYHTYRVACACPTSNFRAAEEVMVIEHHSQKNYDVDGVEQYVIVTILPMSLFDASLDLSPKRFLLLDIIPTCEL